MRNNTATISTILPDLGLRPVKLPENFPYPSLGLAIGNGPSALEVLVTTATTEPKLPTVRSAWKARNAGRAAPLMLVVLHNRKATVCGPAGDDPPAYPNVDIGQAERICREALEQPDRHAALRCLRDALPSVESNLPGIRNEGFLATHELARGLRLSEQWRRAWADANQKAKAILANRGDTLLRSLGFHIEKVDQVTSVLRAGVNGKKIAVAVLLSQAEAPELQADRFGGLSPVSYALAVADRENLPYVVVSQGSKLRLYPVKVGVGVGRRGRTETYVEAHTGLLRDSDAAYLWLLFSAEALIDGGTLDRIIDESKRFAGDLAERLRERIYGEVVPRLAEGLAAARGLRKPTATDLAGTYEMAMTVLFRMLFIAYAEDKDLLPYRWNGLYRARSLKTKATELLELVRSDTPFDEGDSLWEEVKRLFRSVEKGNREWGVPEYDGGLFTTDPDVSRVGALIDDVTLPNRTFGEVLKGLLLIETPEGWGPVDFRSLGVREFGTVYEGLLESELSIAETDLTVDKEGYYRPCRAGEEPLVKKQRIYLHNRSGARKATGSYFTKSFAVEHLLDHALEPALADHLARLDKLDDDQAGEAFFDFRVADIAMGSGHFLVAAVDRIERALTQYLSKRLLAGVRTELANLRKSAQEALGTLADQVEIEDTQLLRRLIARRCIYGVDINPVSVNLARLSIWIHTFVPGLPLSLLDHNLVVGNSLVGIGTIKEIEDKINEDNTDPDNPHQQVMFRIDANMLVGEALQPLERMARIADATAAEITRARKAMREAEEACTPAKALCDIVAASRMTNTRLPIDLAKWDQVKLNIVDSREHKAALKTLADLSPLHFPVAFPEVFLRPRPGFDVILGNPPWEEVMCDVNEFWGRFMPGFRGLAQREQERILPRFREERSDLEDMYQSEQNRAEKLRSVLMTGPYPGMQTGHPDLYKAFCWRFWNLISLDAGSVGVVLPRSAWTAKGSTEFRVAVFRRASPLDLTMLVNNRQWVFPEVHPQYSIGLVAIQRRQPVGSNLRLRGPFASLKRFLDGVHRAPAKFSGADVEHWNDTASLPLLPTEESLEVFAQLRRAPRLDLNDRRTWRARPIQGDLNATWGKPLMDFNSPECPKGFWPIYKGESFDIWEPDTGSYYAWADPNIVIQHLHEKTLRGTHLSKSAFSEFEPRVFVKPESLPCHAPRIAFRDVSRATDSRTVRVALVPPKVFIANQAPYLLWPRGDERDQAYLLAMLSSIALDWYARRFVETHLNFYVFNPFPVPRPPNTDPLWQRAVALAGRLAGRDKRYAKWAEAVGVDYGKLPDDEKDDHINELDAVAAQLYGLEERHLIHIFETFHEGWGPGTVADHPTLGDHDRHLNATLKYYREWKKRRA